MPNYTFSDFTNGGAVSSGDIVVGLRDGMNTRFTFNGAYPTSIPVPISEGGTASTSAASARTALGLAIGTNVQPWAGANLVLGGALTTVGAHTVSFTFTANTAVTFPTSGTLATSSQILIPENVTTNSVQLAVNTSYTINTASGLTTLTLPAAIDATSGDVIEITGYGPDLWTIAQNASQIIHAGSNATTTGVGGSLASTDRYDCIRIKCVANSGLIWIAQSVVGNLTAT